MDQPTKSDSVYWRREYQAEANENTRIRKILGIDPNDPDETLSAQDVKAVLKKHYERGVRDAAEKAYVLTKDENLRQELLKLAMHW